jgi:predicted transcriptional regulator
MLLFGLHITENIMSKIVIEDQLAYVRKRVSATPVSEWQGMATAAGVPHRTLYYLKNADFDPRYSTVKKLYGHLKRAEAKPARAARAK